MARVIGVLSGKGGVGKTTVVANLGAAMTNVFNKNVLIFDSNIHTSHLGLHLGMYEDMPVTLREVLRRKAPIIHAVYVHPSTGIRIVPAPLSGDDVNFTGKNCRKLVNEVRNNHDIVILDCAPGLGKEVLTAVSAIDEAIIVTTPEIPAVTDALKTVDILNRLRKRPLGIVVNRCNNEKYELTTDEINSTCKCDVIARIPEDKKIPESISKGVPVVLSYPYSGASIALKNLAAYLLGVEYVEESFLARIKRFFNFGGIRYAPRKPVRYNAVEELSEVSDIQKLKEELSKEVKSELKKRIIEKVKKRLEGGK